VYSYSSCDVTLWHDIVALRNFLAANVRQHRTYMQPIVTDQVAWSITLVSPAEMTEPIELPFGLRARVGPGNHILDRV